MPRAADDDWDGAWPDQPPWFPAPAAGAPDLELQEHLGVVLDRLGGRHADVLRRRVGLADLDRQTLEEVGADYGVTRERIRQIQSKGLVRLGARMTRHGREAGSPEAVLRSHLDHQLRSMRRIERGAYLRRTFPDANVVVLGRLVERCSAPSATQVADWIAESLAADEEQRRARERQRSAAERLDRLLRGVLWPERVGLAPWPGFDPVRSVGDDGQSHWSPKLGRDVHSESGLESQVLGVLEHAPQVVAFCEQPVWIDYRWFDGARRYVPDVAVVLSDGRVVVVEVKPQTLWADGINLAKWNAATRWCAHRGWGFAVLDGRRHPGEMLAHADESDFALLEELTEHGPADFAALRRTWFGSGRTWTTLVSTALRYGFAFQRAPFRVHRARRSPWLDALRSAAPH